MTIPEQVVEVTIIHGDLETEAEVRSIQALRNCIEPWWIATVGTNDTTCFRLRLGGMETLMRNVRAHRRSWWKITMTSELPLRTTN